MGYCWAVYWDFGCECERGDKKEVEDEDAGECWEDGHCLGLSRFGGMIFCWII